jgi:hypothetical protein
MATQQMAAPNQAQRLLHQLPLPRDRLNTCVVTAGLLSAPWGSTQMYSSPIANEARSQHLPWGMYVMPSIVVSDCAICKSL